MRDPIDFRTKLTPIRHATLENHHRVPVAFIDGRYEVYVGDRMVRIFSEENLPDNIKALITMIRAGQTSPDLTQPQPLSYFTHAYDHPPNSEFYEIGWFVTDKLFIVVIPTNDLTYLKGDQYNDLCLVNYRLFGSNVLSPSEPSIPFLEEFFWSHRNLR